jgi:tRNA pseudouridine13 synthase
MHAMPRSAHAERRCLSVLARGENANRAVYSIERLIQSFLVTAWQSAVFNTVLDERIANNTYSRLIDGDLAFKHDKGAVFPIDAATLADSGVSDPDQTLAQRLTRIDISPSGPMWGPEMTEASAAVGEMERRIMESSGVPLERLRAYWQHSREALLGQRRALRIPVTHPDVEGGMDEHGEYIKLRFELPRGAFATSVMQEIMKTEPAGDEEDA